MIVKMFVVGSFSTNCYVVSCEQSKEAIIIDPGFDDNFEAGKIFKFIGENNLVLKFKYLLWLSPRLFKHTNNIPYLCPSINRHVWIINNFI